ncbi:diaminopimelate epimerase [Thermincola ferriacetica]|uniref:Diaminopimelate epimerase n=1 Tax=Thermincola ferriacetica TaxID=281456 RepID=A0A0L6VZY2_9FIRM|nr:diaminopimelate epimerase [Thermincola ferriacetica]KNZ68708.1 diaminopimelate epimerase [Thermincola ferriacetica]
MQFTKMHGLGNDFILIEDFDKNNLANGAELAVRLCNRKTGIGADGLVFILPSETADIQMRIFNPDGSEPEMCGNAIRCFARYLYDHGIVKKQTIRVETLAGIRIPRIIENPAGEALVEVDMGEPELERGRIPMLGEPGKVVAEPLPVNGSTYNVTCVSMGNPHCVIFVDNAEDYPVAAIGPRVETHTAFPNKTNVEFVQVLNENEVRMRVWERGAGITMACGTGACASAVAAHLNGFTGREVIVHLDGGDLFIRWAQDNHVYMMGPAAYVFKGTTLE